jgi:HSP20 family molecular chaperone IbpA
MLKKKSFLERITGGLRLEDEEEVGGSPVADKKIPTSIDKNSGSKVKELNLKDPKWEEESEAELTVDVYQSATDIFVQTMVAGVQPDNLSITITRDMITIKGKRAENQSINTENYFVQELYWGAFSRTISLPEEIDPEEAEAVEKHGLLIIKLPKIDKEKKATLKVKSI